MDASEVWQENKRFIITVGSGLLVFLIGKMVVDGLYVADINSSKRTTVSAQSKLKAEMFSASDLSLAESENEELTKRYALAREAAEFIPRAPFSLASGSGSAQSAYQNAKAAVMDRTSDLASRKRAFLPDGLDLELVQTSNVDAIERHLHALDLLERALTMALESGVRQIKKIEVKLDPGFQSSRGLGAIERTEVTIDCVADAASVTRWVAMAETPLGPSAAGGSSGASPLGEIRSQALPIRAADLRTSDSKRNDDVRARITFDVVRIHEIESEEEDEG